MSKKGSHKRKDYHYQPKGYNPNWTPVRRIFLSLLGSVLVLSALYFWAIPLFSNIDLFWSFFRPNSKPTPSEQRQGLLPAPYLQALPKATNEETIAIKGFSKPGATVNLIINESVRKDALVDKEGGFDFGEITLAEGENRIYIVAKDDAGNESKPSTTQIVIYDHEPPELEIEAPTDGLKIEKEEERRIEVKGKTEPDCQVTVSGHWARVDEKGNFSYQLRLNEGKNEIEIMAKDKAGNETKTELTVEYDPEED